MNVYSKILSRRVDESFTRIITGRVNENSVRIIRETKFDDRRESQFRLTPLFKLLNEI